MANVLFDAKKLKTVLAPYFSSGLITYYVINKTVNVKDLFDYSLTLVLNSKKS